MTHIDAGQKWLCQKVWGVFDWILSKNGQGEKLYILKLFNVYEQKSLSGGKANDSWVVILCKLWSGMTKQPLRFKQACN